MTEQEFLYQIEEYLKGELSSDKAKAFEAAMEKQPKWKLSFEEHKETIAALKDLSAFESKKAEFRALLDSTEEGKKTIDGAQTHSLFPQKLRRIAAILLLPLFLAFAYWAYQQSMPNPQELATQYQAQTIDKTLGEISGTMGGDEMANTKQLLDKAETLYHDKQPKEALATLQEIPTNNNTTLHYHATLLRGLCYFDLAQSDEARTQFQTLQKHPNHTYDDQADWFLALLDLQEGQVEEAKKRLEGIVQEGGSFAREAKELLEKL